MFYELFKAVLGAASAVALYLMLRYEGRRMDERKVRFYQNLRKIDEQARRNKK